MTLLSIVIGVSLILSVAYVTYGGLLSRLFQLDDRSPTPAVSLQDGEDFLPTAPQFLLGQHFSAIAAAGPIVGPIVAGLTYGWVPALIWIVLGCIFIGGVHDFASLVASVRHQGRSIAEVVRQHMSGRSYALFLSFIWLALVYIIVAFTDITAGAFVESFSLKSLGLDHLISGPGVATSSLLYLVLPLLMGVSMRYFKMSLGMATLVFLPLVGLSIYVGQLPGLGLDLAGLFSKWNPQWSAQEAASQARKTWDVLLLCYCLLAGTLPVWLLLQPRGHLGGYFLYAALLAAAAGLIVGQFRGSDAVRIAYPAFTQWNHERQGPMFPMLFVLIACGACSGFHSLIASGTTSKQLRQETDARVIGYGTMLLEGLVAVISLSCVMMLPQDSPLVRSDANQVYAAGLGSYLAECGVPAKFAAAFALMAFTTFVYDTLDVCTRLGRYVIQELTGWRGSWGKWLGTGLTAGIPILFVMRQTVSASGKPLPAWKEFWTLFGASNQLLAALTLLGVTVWLWRTRRKAWVWLVAGLPATGMYVMSTWALTLELLKRIRSEEGFHWNRLSPLAMQSFDLVALVGLVLLVLAALMLFEAGIALLLNPHDSKRA